jgi:hypothetical protein
MSTPAYTPVHKMQSSQKEHCAVCEEAVGLACIIAEPFVAVLRTCTVYKQQTRAQLGRMLTLYLSHVKLFDTSKHFGYGVPGHILLVTTVSLSNLAAFLSAPSSLAFTRAAAAGQCHG